MSAVNSVILAAESGPSNARLPGARQALKPTQRSFLARLLDRTPQGHQARLAHARGLQVRLCESPVPSRSADAAPAKPPALELPIGRLRNGDPAALFDLGVELARAQDPSVRELLCARKADPDPVDVLAGRIAQEGRLSQAVARTRAELVFMGMVGQCVDDLREQQRKAADAYGRDASRRASGGDGQAAGLEALEALQGHLWNCPALGAQVWMDTRRRVAGVLAEAALAWAAGPAQASIQGLLAGIELPGSQPELKAKADRLDAYGRWLTHADAHPGKSPEQALHLQRAQQAHRQARDDLSLLRTRDAHLDELSRALGEPAGRAAGKHGLVAMLRGCKAARDYLPSRRAVDRLMALPSPQGPKALLARLDACDSPPLLQGAAAGVPDDVDAVLPGAPWHEVARQLKAAAVAPDDEAGRVAMEVQHGLRVVRGALDQAMQAQATRLGKPLPACLVTAAKPNTALIQWLLQNAPGLVKDRDLLVGTWISLSYYDPRKNLVDMEAVQPLLDAVGLQGMEPSTLKQYIQQGFASTQAVRESVALVTAFTRAMKDSSLLTEMEAARSLRFRSAELARGLLRDLTGKTFDACAGPEVDAAMKAVFEAEREASAPLDPQELQALQQRRDELLAVVRAVPWAHEAWRGQPADLRWLLDADKVAATRAQRDAVLALFELKKQHGAAADAVRKAELGGQIARAYVALADFDVVELRNWTRPPGTPAPGVNLLGEAIPRIEALNALQALARRLKPDPQRLETFRRKAIQLAVLQDGAVQGDGDFRVAEHRAGILRRLQRFGFGAGSGDPVIRRAVVANVDKVSKSRKTLLKQCDIVARQLKMGGALAALGSVQALKSVFLTEPGVRREALRRLVSNQFDELRGKPGACITMHFGRTTGFAASLPVVFVAQASATLQASHQSGLEIRHEADGRWSVLLDKSYSARQGLAVELVGQVVSAMVEAKAAHGRGLRLDFQDADAAQRFVLALAQGEPITPQVWLGGQVHSSATASGRCEAGVSAAAALGVATLSAQAAVAAQWRVQTFKNLGHEVEVHDAGWQAVAGAGAALVGDIGSASVEAGRVQGVRKTLEKACGFFQQAEMTLWERVVGGNAQGCLARVLKKAGVQDHRCAGLSSSVADAQDGWELGLRLKLRAPVLEQANGLLVRAQRLRLEAALGSDPSRRQALGEQADALAAQALALTSDLAHYEPVGLTVRSNEWVEVARNLGAFQDFAAAQTSGNRYIPLPAAA